ncbi:hypothetical protein D3C76_1740080 [compost metagenome]
MMSSIIRKICLSLLYTNGRDTRRSITLWFTDDKMCAEEVNHPVYMNSIFNQHNHICVQKMKCNRSDLKHLYSV